MASEKQQAPVLFISFFSLECLENRLHILTIGSTSTRSNGADTCAAQGPMWIHLGKVSEAKKCLQTEKPTVKVAFCQAAFSLRVSGMVSFSNMVLITKGPSF